MPLKGKEVVPSSKVASLNPLLNDFVSHKTSLFYGTGIKPASGMTHRKTLQRFVQRLKEEEACSESRMLPDIVKNEVEVMDPSGNSSESFISQMDIGRYSRLSRTRTPGSPILEEIQEDEET